MTKKKVNCWEHKKCGREEGGAKAAELGVCIATLEDRLDGVHGGTNAGRSCWIVKNTLCGGNVQSNMAVKLGNCLACDFYKAVMSEEIEAKTSSELRGMLGAAR